MNRIGRIQFDFRMQNESFARELYSQWDRFFAQSFEPIADAILTKYGGDSGIIEIERLELDLGTFSEITFYDQFPLVLREKLEEVLLVLLAQVSKLVPEQQASELSTGVRFQTYANVGYTFQLLAYFLLHGNIPWHTDPKYKDIPLLFLEVIRTNGKKLKQFLQTYGHYTSLQERLVYQLNAPELEQGIRLFSPSESTFIISYLKMLSVKYKSISEKQIDETTYRHTVWKVVYAYVLTDRSSYFNKKTFLSQTLIRLSTAINVTYDYLLNLLTDKPENWMDIAAIPVELFRILNELKKEITEESYKMMTIDPEKLYKTLEGMFRNDLSDILNQPTREALEAILSDPEICRAFLKFLTEEEMARLLPVIIPHESHFVISYARSLDRQKERDHLSGKAGSEFYTLKWQVIFPLLFENKGGSLNRKYFVISVLRKIAAHYNLSVVELVTYFNHPQTLLELDHELKEIFLQLCNELLPVSNQKESDDESAIIKLGQSVQNRRELDDQQQKALFKVLNNQSSRKKLLETITEKERKELIRLFYKAESEFILSYASSLEQQEKTKWLEGKAGGGFRQLKWEFIWVVLTKDNHTAFNRRYFVADVLKKLAGHYNLGYTELLGYFYTENTRGLFSQEIQKILETLYLDEMEQMIRQSVSVLSSKSKQTLVTLLTQNSKTMPGSFVIDYLLFLDHCKKAGLLPQISGTDFSSVIWKQTAGLLFSSGNRIHLNKFQFVKQLLGHIARYYHVSFAEFIEKIQQANQLENIPSEIMHIQNDLYDENKYLVNNMFNLKDEIMEKIENVYVENAGVVLLSPWFPRLFTMLGLTESHKFKSKDAQIKAIYVIQYAIYEKTDFPEHELLLNKIMVGWDMKDAVPAKVELTEEEKKTTMSMVDGAKNNWPKLKNSSTEALKQAFLQRQGKLEETEKLYKLTIEEKAYDILLDSLPWNFRMIKFPWMAKRVEVKWR